MLKNPLRYPGGKSFLTGYVEKVLKVNDLQGCRLYEPYAGSAAVGLQMLSRGLVSDVLLIEADPLVFSFWKSVVECPAQLCESIEEIPVTLDTWHMLLPLRSVQTPLEYPILQLGLACLFYNRTNYSGILRAGPIGGKNQSSPYPIDCRFNKPNIIAQIQAIASMRDRIAVRWDDALSYLKVYRRQLHESRCFVYIDPPYYQERAKRLYRYHYTDRDHIRLASLMKQSQYPWLISYDDHPFVKDLYLNRKDDIRMQWLYMDYSAQKHKQGSELLISNLELPPVERINSVRFAASPPA